MSLHAKGYSNAISLLRNDKVTREEAWSYEERELAKEDYLSVDKATDDYDYPVSKNGMVFRRGVVAAKARALAKGDTVVAEAASQLLEAIDATKKVKAVSKEDLPIFEGESVEEFMETLRKAAVDSGQFGTPRADGYYDIHVVEARGDTVVVRDWVADTMVRATVSRDSDGAFTFSNMEPVEERRVFKPKSLLKEDESRGLATAVVLSSYEPDKENDWFPPAQTATIARRFLKESREVWGPGHKPGPEATVVQSFIVPYPTEEDYDKAMAVRVIQKEDGTVAVEGEPHRVLKLPIGNGFARSGDWVMEVQAETSEDRRKIEQGIYDAYSYGDEGSLSIEVDFDPNSLVLDEISVQK